MKQKLTILTALLVLIATMGVAQEADTPANEVKRSVDPVSVRKTIDSVEYQKEVLGRVFGWEGLLPKMQKSKNPLQLFNPLAPAEFGNAYDNVTIDEERGRATGIKVIGIRF